MQHSTSEFALTVVNDLKAKLFSDPVLVDRAEACCRQMVSEKVAKDLHNTSSAAIEQLVDDILSIEYLPDLQRFLHEQNPNLLAFLHARFLHAQCFFREQLGKLVPVEDEPKLVARWSLIDLWEQSPNSSDRY